MQSTLSKKELDIKNACVEFMFSYQQKDLKKMLSFCNPDGIIEFAPLGESGRGKITELGKTIWGMLIECFPDLDNTIDATVAEDNNCLRCQVVIRGTQARDFADIINK